mmetsp:Transcript_8172/g.26091  ORF Transcript_8172/g.26091 Transcript_8172/m.26091 type:complete len:377 (+) Transcript_8172:93-1223(+)
MERSRSASRPSGGRHGRPSRAWPTSSCRSMPTSRRRSTRRVCLCVTTSGMRLFERGTDRTPATTRTSSLALPASRRLARCRPSVPCRTSWPASNGSTTLRAPSTGLPTKRVALALEVPRDDLPCQTWCPPWAVASDDVTRWRMRSTRQKMSGLLPRRRVPPARLPSEPGERRRRRRGRARSALLPRLSERGQPLRLRLRRRRLRRRVAVVVSPRTLARTAAWSRARVGRRRTHERLVANGTTRRSRRRRRACGLQRRAKASGTVERRQASTRTCRTLDVSERERTHQPPNEQLSRIARAQQLRLHRRDGQFAHVGSDHRVVNAQVKRDVGKVVARHEARKGRGPRVPDDPRPRRKVRVQVSVGQLSARVQLVHGDA